MKRRKDFSVVLPYAYLAATDPNCGDFYNGVLEIPDGSFDDWSYALVKTVLKVDTELPLLDYYDHSFVDSMENISN